jgi:hypothetical protein
MQSKKLAIRIKNHLPRKTNASVLYQKNLKVNTVMVKNPNLIMDFNFNSQLVESVKIPLMS